MAFGTGSKAVSWTLDLGTGDFRVDSGHGALRHPARETGMAPVMFGHYLNQVGGLRR